MCGKTQMLVSFVSVLIGFGLGVLVLSQSQDPAISMAIASAGRGIGALQGSMAPMWPQAKLRGNIAPQAYRVPLTVRADSKLLQKLNEEINKARECTITGTHEECLVQWDAVEELSAAVAHAEPKTSSAQFPKLSESDQKIFKETMAKFAAARAQVPKDAPDRKAVGGATYEAIAAALAAKQQAVSQIGNERLTKLDEKIQVAKEEAKASGSAVDWDIVEELMQERSHLMKFDGSN